MASPFIAPDFEPPRSFSGPGFRLEPLGPEHNERDHAAWMSSIEHIHSTSGFGREERGWPIEMSLDENLGDLQMHADEFVERTSFTYSVLDGDAVIGCLYIYPGKTAEFDADVRSWVTKARAELDVVLWRSVSAWLEEDWPFERVNYASRDSA